MNQKHLVVFDEQTYKMESDWKAHNVGKES